METKTREKLIYLAGIFDGEGCVLIITRPPRDGRSKCYDVACTVNMIDWAPIKLLKDIFGGTYHIRKKGGKFLAAEWRVTAIKAKVFMESILVFSLVKKPQLEMALEFIRECKNKSRKGYFGGKRKLHIKELARMENYKVALSNLKQVHNLN